MIYFWLTGGASNLVILCSSGVLTEFSNLFLEKLNDGMYNTLLSAEHSEVWYHNFCFYIQQLLLEESLSLLLKWVLNLQYCFSNLFFLKSNFVVQESHGKFEKPWFHYKTGKSQVIVTFLFQLRGMIQVESINVGVVHQDKITGITVGRLWDAPVLITYVSLFICIN